MEKQTLKTLAASAQGLYKEKGSKFMAYAFPIDDESDVDPILKQLKKDHPKSRHACYAYYLGEDNETFRINDDGEPSGTAGKPIAGQILSHGLTNVLVAVVRYFGGTKLGTSGLTKAYKAAADDALTNSKTLVKNIVAVFEITCNYDQLKGVQKMISQENLRIVNQEFEDVCTFTLAVNANRKTEIEEKMKVLSKKDLRYVGKRLL